MQAVTAANGQMAQCTCSGETTFVGKIVENDTVLGVLEVGESYAGQQALLDELMSMKVVLVESQERRGLKLHGTEYHG